MKINRNRYYLLTLLLTIQTLNYMDGLTLGVVLQDIKLNLILSDTQLGLLSGIAFALFYSLMGIPIARWADRGDRVTLISITTAMWGAAVMTSGLVANFWQLVTVRIGVAVGEAGCFPSSLSLISDYFERAELPRAVARLGLSWPLALGLGYFAAGWIDQLYGWRWAFISLGAPGLLFALLAFTTLRDPRKKRKSALQVTAATGNELPNTPLVATLVQLWHNIAYRHLLVAHTLIKFFIFGVLQWQPSLFIRSYGLKPGELGVWFAGVYGIAAAAGVYLGGEIATRYSANDEGRQLKAIAFLYVLYSILTAGVYLAPNYHTAFAIYGFANFAVAMGNGPIFAATQSMVPSKMRAMSIALILFVSNLVGMGFGPLAVGVLSDAMSPHFGSGSLRYALLAFCPGFIWAGFHFWLAGQAQALDRATTLISPICEDATNWLAHLSADHKCETGLGDASTSD